MTIFDQTYAVFSPKFREEFYNFPNDAMFQRICDCVGVVYVQEDDGDKLLGSWESVKKAHDVLAAYLLLKSLSTPMAFSDKSEKTSLLTSTDFDKSERRTSPSATETHVSFASAPSGFNMNGEVFQKDYMHFEEGDESFDLDPHYKAELGKVKPQYDDEGRVVYNCDICSYFGHKRHNLVVHKIRTHIRPYKCGNCGRGFGLRKDLRRHHNNKRNCSSYGKDYKRHCGERRLKLKDLRFLNLDDTSQQEASSINYANLPENASKDDTDSSTFVGKDTEQNTLNTIESNPNHKRGINIAGAEIFNKYHPSVLDKEQCNSEFEGNKTSHQEEGNLSSSNIDTEKIFVKAEPVEFTASQANENHYNSFSIHSEPWNKATFHKKPSNPELIEGGQFKCAICNFSSLKKQQVEDHTKRVHCKIFECTICGSMFGMKKDLNRHYRRTHRIHFKCRGKESHGYAD
ncbi:zinc finger protein 224-like [Saccostrea cucullata]|uniref:zinc finger protein 224-like n=1 Tax=Saccostrea cuccullata TaxID=36930 RepID=UPI002ED1D890